MKTLLRMVTNKIFIGGIVVLAQFAILLMIVMNISLNFGKIYVLLGIVSATVMLIVSSSNVNPTYRLAWIVVIMLIPPVGEIMYLLFGAKKVPKKLRQNIGDAYRKDMSIFKENDQEALLRDIPKWAGLINYIENTSNFPLYEHTGALYLESGEVKFEKLFEDIQAAKKFIFIEYFIIKEGVLWDRLYELLSQKVKEGVLVRMIYDDWGCAMFPELQGLCDKAGIDAVAFNPLVPKLAIQMNNRDHRKICVIDEKIGYVGGMNIADEYINIGSKFGHWKDTAVRIEGDAVHSLTLMFLQFYSYYTGKHEDPEKFCHDFYFEGDDLGYVIPFSDAPTDKYDLGLDAHLSMINTARDYVYIMTPYLIIGYELTQALIMAARSGVDVRILLPHIPDKWIVNQVTKSNYERLLEGGVKIHEYEPGFVHSKVFVVDDEVCTVGTTNMDYRSYYMHFECSILFVNNPVVIDCKKDVLNTIENQSIEISLEMARSIPAYLKIFRSFAGLFSGLM